MQNIERDEEEKFHIKSICTSFNLLRKDYRRKKFSLKMFRMSSCVLSWLWGKWHLLNRKIEKMSGKFLNYLKKFLNFYENFIILLYILPLLSSVKNFQANFWFRAFYFCRCQKVHNIQERRRLKEEEESSFLYIQWMARSKKKEFFVVRWWNLLPCYEDDQESLGNCYRK